VLIDHSCQQLGWRLTEEKKTTLPDQKQMESFEMYHWRKTEKISWNDYVRNEEVL
jgi:hypothetical protein